MIYLNSHGLQSNHILTNQKPYLNQSLFEISCEDHFQSKGHLSSFVTTIWLRHEYVQINRHTDLHFGTFCSFEWPASSLSQAARPTSLKSPLLCAFLVCRLLLV